MTPEEALKIDPARYSVHGDVATALRVLQNALREAQAQTVQMREDAAREAEAEGKVIRALIGHDPSNCIPKRIRALPAPAVAPVAQKHDPDKGCAGCENHEESLTFKEHFCRTDAGMRVSLLPYFKTARNDPAPAWCPKRAPVAAPKPCEIAAPPIDFSEEGAPDRLDAFAKALVDGLTDRTGVALDDRHGAIHVVREAVIRAIEAAGGKP